MTTYKFPLTTKVKWNIYSSVTKDKVQQGLGKLKLFLEQQTYQIKRLKKPKTIDIKNWRKAHTKYSFKINMLKSNKNFPYTRDKII